MASTCTPLHPSEIARFHRYYTAEALEQGISVNRALYNSARIRCLSAEDVDTMYRLPAGTAEAWTKEHNLPPLDGVVVAMSYEDILKIRKL